MSAAVAPAATGRSRLGRRSTWLILAGLVVATVAALWAGSGGGHSARLDPQNPGGSGAKALAQVLGDQGVQVTVVRSADAYDATQVDGATVVVTSSGNLGRSTYQRLVEHGDPARMVLVEPSAGVGELTGARPERVSDPVRLSASCTGADVPTLEELELEVDRGASFPAGPAGCYPTGERVLLAGVGSGRWLFGGGQALTNDDITRADNAAVAVRLLGGADRLVWYVPDQADLAAGDEVGLSTVVPRWLGPALWLGLFTLIALVVWRARRLGPLATEPLPVSVRAIESTQSRGRLYERAKDRDHAARELRRASLEYARQVLHLPRSLGDQALVEAAAGHLGVPAQTLYPLLLPAAATPIQSDDELTGLTTGLQDFDEAMRKAAR